MGFGGGLLTESVVLRIARKAARRMPKNPMMQFCTTAPRFFPAVMPPALKMLRAAMAATDPPYPVVKKWNGVVTRPGARATAAFVDDG